MINSIYGGMKIMRLCRVTGLKINVNDISTIIES